MRTLGGRDRAYVTMTATFAGVALREGKTTAERAEIYNLSIIPHLALAELAWNSVVTNLVGK